MNKIDFDIENMSTRDISGFGGGYEEGCQKMLKNGLRFLKGREIFDWSGYESLEGVFGLCIAESEDTKALDKAIMEGFEDGWKIFKRCRRERG